MYGLVFGRNHHAPMILAALDLTHEDVGRFRDAFITNGEIAVYTRNGGGNRECWHQDSSDEHPWANERCKNRSFEREEDEVVNKSGLVTKTGKRITVRRYVCEAPNSAECACAGCIIEYRLPKHPHYLRDEDDDFDSTYATIYFRFPPEHAELLAEMDSGAEFKPSERWLAALEGLKTGKRPDVERAMRPVMDALAERLRDVKP